MFLYDLPKVSNFDNCRFLVTYKVLLINFFNESIVLKRLQYVENVLHMTLYDIEIVIVQFTGIVM